MTDHCTLCPFAGCPECDYQGGSPSVGRAVTGRAGRLDPVAKTPAPASTGPGRGRTETLRTGGSTP